MRLFFSLIFVLLANCLSVSVALPQSDGGSSNAKINQQSSAKSQNEKNAVLISHPEPKYPSEGKGVQATVVVRMLLKSNGTVSNIEVKSVSPDELPDAVKQAFAREAAKAVRHIKFEPATRDGKPMSQWVSVEVAFHPL